MRDPGPRGMSLSEVLITTVVLMVISSALFWMLLAGKALWLRETGVGSLDQAVDAGLRRIMADFEDSAFDTVTLHMGSDIQAISCLSAWSPTTGQFVTDSQGKPVWQKYVIYYVESSTRTLRRKVLDSTNWSGGFTEPLSQTDLVAQCTAGMRVAESIINMQAVLDGNTSVLTVTLTAQAPNYRDRVDSRQGSLSIHLRNS